jgi:hypothetical protein
METNILPVAANSNDNISTNTWDFHHLSEIFPEPSEEDQKALSEGIKKNGILVPIVIYEGKILDGRARYKAAIEHGVECPTVTYIGSDPIGHVTALNVLRRHLTAGQRALIAARLATLPRGGVECLNSGIPTQVEAARTMGVGRDAVQKAKVIVASGNTDIIDKLKSGKIPLDRAFNACNRKQDEGKKEPTQDERFLDELKKVVHAVNQFSIHGFGETIIHVKIDAEIATLESLCERLRKINTPAAVDPAVAAETQKAMLAALKKRVAEKKKRKEEQQNGVPPLDDASSDIGLNTAA